MFYGTSELLVLLIICVVIIAWLISISLLIDAAKKKGYYRDGGTGKLWFVGFFATPLVVGLYVCALPDRSDADDERPAIPTL